jgi:membrane protein DedA with SNARE-associated domain/membrane-associated phospholipid phosphatase
MNFSDYFNIQPLIEFFRFHPYVAEVLVFFITMLETLALVGAIFPGGIIMPAIGFLIGANVVPAGNTLLCAVIGAIIGDYLSYFIGIYFQDKIHRMWPFTRWPKLLEQGEKYFHVHGGKSVFIGRFVMVVRVVIPLIAGMLKLPFLRFSIAAIPSASLWAVGYMLPGILLGALSLELPPKVAAEFTLWVFLTIIGLWLVIWIIQHFFKQIWRMIDRVSILLWQYCKNHKTLCWITDITADPRKPDNHQQMILLVMALVVFVLFLLVSYQVAIDGFITKLDNPVYYLLKSLRIPSIDYLAIVATLMGDNMMLAIATVLFLVWLLLKRYKYIAAHWFGIMVFGVGTTALAKILIHLPRPNVIVNHFSTTATKFLTCLPSFGTILYERCSSSFPSSHTSLSLIFYGFLAVIIARESKKQDRFLPYVVSGILVVLIAISRLYLGMHWLSDILGGILLGLFVVLLVTISYRRRHNFHLSAHKITMAAVGIFAMVWFGYSVISFHKHVKDYALTWKQPKITSKQIAMTAPLYRLNRLGHVVEALNVEWIGNIGNIKNQLLKQGWREQPVSINLLNIVRSFFDSAVIYHLPIFPQLYHNKHPVLLLTKKTVKPNSILVLYLWASDIDLKDIDQPLWLGTVKYYSNDLETLSLKRLRSKQVFIGAIEELTKSIKSFSWQQKIYKPEQQPAEMADLHWNGKVLEIW